MEQVCSKQLFQLLRNSAREKLPTQKNEFNLLTLILNLQNLKRKKYLLSYKTVKTVSNNVPP